MMQIYIRYTHTHTVYRVTLLFINFFFPSLTILRPIISYRATLTAASPRPPNRPRNAPSELQDVPRRHRRRRPIRLSQQMIWKTIDFGMAIEFHLEEPQKNLKKKKKFTTIVIFVRTRSLRTSRNDARTKRVS